MAIDDRSLRILEQLRYYLSSIVDAHARETVAAWVRAWDDLAPELAAALDDLAVAAGEGKVTRAQLLRSRRLVNALDVIETELSDLIEGSGTRIVRQLRDVVNQAGQTTDRLVASQLPPGTPVSDTWSRVDRRQIEAIIERTTEQITKASFPLSGEATASIKRNLIRGMLTGTNPREVARRAVRQAEQGFNGGLTRALTIARTEMLDAHRAAAQLAEKAHANVLTSWIWACSLGERTCPACWAMHGTEHPLDEPGPVDHQNGRCVRIPKTKSWRELGFNIAEPPSLLPDAGSAFAALAPTQQLTILGPSRFAAWRAGKFPMGAWAQKQTNAGWRDSFVAAKAPTSFKGARRSKLDDRSLPYRFGRGSKAFGQGPKAALQIVAKIHNVPQLRDPVVVLPMANPKPGAQGHFTAVPFEIRINPNAIGKSLTTVHEFGHYLDYQDFGGTTMMASRHALTAEWQAFRTAVASSPEMREILSDAIDQLSPTRDHATYLLKPEETFARAYAQWIALKSGSKTLKKDLARFRKLPGVDAHRQWSDENFAPIADALDALFASRLVGS